MMDFAFFLIIVVMICLMFVGNSPTRSEVRRRLKPIEDFFEYLEEHKADLPAHVQSKLEELENEMKKMIGHK